MHTKCGFLPSSENGLAFARLSERTARRTSSTVSLSSPVRLSLLSLPPAYCTLLPELSASLVTHSMQVPSCSPKSSAESAITLSYAVMSSRSVTSTYAPYCSIVASSVVCASDCPSGVTPSLSLLPSMLGSNRFQRRNSTLLPLCLGMGRFCPNFVCTNLDVALSKSCLS